MDRVLRHGFAGGFDLHLAGLTRGLALFASVARERRALGGLDARLRDDIGVDRDAAEREAARPFWDAPAGR